MFALFGGMFAVQRARERFTEKLRKPIDTGARKRTNQAITKNNPGFSKGARGQRFTRRKKGDLDAPLEQLDLRQRMPGPSQKTSITLEPGERWPDPVPSFTRITPESTIETTRKAGRAHQGEQLRRGPREPREPIALETR